MAEEFTQIDISGIPDMMRIVREMRRKNRTVLLRSGSESLAIVIPIETARCPASHSVSDHDDTDLDAFLTAAGSWEGLVDGEELKRYIRESRGSSRPPVRL